MNRKMILLSLIILVCLVFTSCGNTAAADRCRSSAQTFSAEAADDISKTGDGLLEQDDLWYLAKTVYANWSDDAVIGENSLNREKLETDPGTHLPVFVFQTKDDIDRFRTEFADILTFDRGYNEVPSFDETIEGYDDSFFEEYSIMLAYVPSSSGSFRYDVDSVTADDACLCMNIRKANDPQTYTCDMAGWFVMAELYKSVVQNCSSFDARLPEMGQEYKSVTLPGHIVFGTFSWKEVERAVADFDDQTLERIRTDGFVNIEPTDSFWPTDRAKAETTHEYKLAQYFRDEEEDMWMVKFFDSEEKGPFEEIYMTGDGITKLIISGEMTEYSTG